MLNNKSAMIWGFEEMIDNNTNSDGNTLVNSLTNIKDIINIIKDEKISIDFNVHDMMIKYNNVLLHNTHVFNCSDDVEDMINTDVYKYYLCGWTEHAIVIFVKRNEDETYNLGIINCGQGNEFQGRNNDSCNGIIIFKNHNKDEILVFFNSYQKYYLYSNNFTNLQTYKSFYLLLFYTILGEEIVDFSTLTTLHENIIFYTLPLQNIGSCSFTNTINIVYYLFVEDNPEFANDVILNLYLAWYNKMKGYIRDIIYTEIITSENKLKYYNIYKYILDTNIISDTHSDSRSEYETTFSTEIINTIETKNYNYKIDIINNQVLYINRSIVDNLTYKFWSLYINNQKFSDIYNSAKIEASYRHDIFLSDMFSFFYKVSSFDNNMKALIPLLILYDFKNTYTLDPSNKNDNKFWEPLNVDFLKKHLNPKCTNGISIKKIIYSCICMLIGLGVSSHEKKRFYTRSNDDNEKQQKDNFAHYNCKIFQYIPIINNYYCEIVKTLIEDLYNNIEIFPNINDNNHLTKCLGYWEIKSNTYTNDTYFFKFLTYVFNKSSDDDINLSFTQENSKLNFLLWYIFIHNIKDNNFFTDYDSEYTYINFEVYGYIKRPLDISTTTLQSLVTTLEIDTNIIPPPNSFISYNQIIKVFREDIDKKLDAYDINTLYLLVDTLKLYIIYFYLCYLDADNIIPRIIHNMYFDKFNVHIIKYFKDIYYEPFKTIIDIYTYTYELDHSIEKKLFSIDEKTLIPCMEKKYFTLKVYEYYNSTEKDLYISIISFYNICTVDYNLIFYKNNQNTQTSIELINILLEKDISIYLILNFWFKKNNNIIEGTHKNNDNITIICDSNNKPSIYTEYKKKYSICLLTDLVNPVYIGFYNIMSHNDIGIFLYKEQNNNTYYLKTFRYNFIFTMKNNKIFITMDTGVYEVKWCNDEDTYNVYGILKLYKTTPTIPTVIDKFHSKIICIYNYDNIIRAMTNDIVGFTHYMSKNYIDKKFKPFLDTNNMSTFDKLKNLPDEYKIYHYTILNKYNNKYILTNILDVLSLLTTCLYYNNPFLILKNVEQIKIILHNYDKDIFNKLLNSLFLNFDNIYSLPILFLFYENKYLCDFYYNKSNIIYDRYEILLKIKSVTYPKSFYYSSISVNYDFRDLNYEVLYFQQERMSNTYNITAKNNIVKISDRYNNIYIEHTNEKNIETCYDLLLLNTHIITSDNDKDLFNKLLKITILNFDDECFENNITRAVELHDYLILDSKLRIHPIQELIMGSGKSTVLTSYICILLLNTFFKLNDTNKKIYIVMPEALIKASFETLMKFVFPLFNNIEVLLYPNQHLYTNSIHLYLINDMNYKIMFLDNPMKTDNKYMIYDEVDMMANPLTCELNKPSHKLDLPHSELYDLAKKLYDNIFGENNKKIFWDDIEHKYPSGNRHFIYEINKNNLKQINDKFNNIFKTSTPVITYIRDNILIFILTKQFNLDYGMPENYNLNTVHTYKFKAIPYSAVDSPIMGSEFSDPILTYILTLFCYKFVNNKYRKIDKDFILEYYSNIYSKNITNTPYRLTIFNTLKGFFDFGDESINFEYNHYKKNEEYYKTKYKDIFEINNEDFEIIIKKILEINKSYYQKCKNISFNDLLLSKNVKNFVCFTGTAFIVPPQGVSTGINFHPTDFITKYKTITGETTTQSVEKIINDNTIMKNIYNNKEPEIQTLIDNIFICLKDYDVLIDIGGVFINYNITKFIQQYIDTFEALTTPTKPNKSKKYIVYFDNGRKIYNLETKQFETDKSINQTEKNAFFFFSNKDITGVDVKNIMNSTVHALVVITNKTNMRDFSQGIFRMRRLLEKPAHETFDILFDSIFYNIINPNDLTDKKTRVYNEDCYYNLTEYELRNYIIINLNNQQNIIDNQKTLNLTKQNIFGLSRQSTNTTNEIFLFLYPNSDTYNIEFLKLLDKKYDIDKINILSINSDEYLISRLIKKYYCLLESHNNAINSKINTTVETETETETATITSKKTIFNPPPRSNSNGIVHINFSFSKNTSIINNNILFLYKVKDTSIRNIHRYDMLLVYCSTFNNLFIISTNQLMCFLMNNINITDCTFISLSNINIYGINIDDSIKNELINKFIDTIEKYSSNIINPDDLDKLILYLIGSIDSNPTLLPESQSSKFISYFKKKVVNPESLISKLTLNFDINAPNSKSSEGFINNQSYLIKYIKYKNKYLNLIKNNS